MGNKHGSLANHLETAKKTGALSFTDKKLDEFPSPLTQVTGNLRTLDLSGNKIASLPTWIGQFRLLKSLNLSHNQLSRLPNEIGQLVKLENLLLSANFLKELPATLSNLTNLKVLDCSKNQLSSFPLQLVALPHLNSCDLSGNKIVSVPDDVSKLQVTELNLNQNLVSSISDSLAACPRLKTLRLEENCLSLDALPSQLLSSSCVATLLTAGNLFSEKDLAKKQGYAAYLERYAAVRRKLD